MQNTLVFVLLAAVVALAANIMIAEARTPASVIKQKKARIDAIRLTDSKKLPEGYPLFDPYPHPPPPSPPHPHPPPPSPPGKNCYSDGTDCGCTDIAEAECAVDLAKCVAECVDFTDPLCYVRSFASSNNVMHI